MRRRRKHLKFIGQLSNNLRSRSARAHGTADAADRVKCRARARRHASALGVHLDHVPHSLPLHRRNLGDVSSPFCLVRPFLRDLVDVSQLSPRPRVFVNRYDRMDSDLFNLTWMLASGEHSLVLATVARTWLSLADLVTHVATGSSVGPTVASHADERGSVIAIKRH